MSTVLQYQIRVKLTFDQGKLLQLRTEADSSPSSHARFVMRSTATSSCFKTNSVQKNTTKKDGKNGTAGLSARVVARTEITSILEQYWLTTHRWRQRMLQLAYLRNLATVWCSVCSGRLISELWSISFHCFTIIERTGFYLTLTNSSQKRSISMALICTSPTFLCVVLPWRVKIISHKVCSLASEGSGGAS